MSTELAAPLRQVIDRLRRTQVDGPAAKLKRRFLHSTDTVVAVCDCSDSMEDAIGSLNLRKYEQLRIALDDVRAFYPALRIIAFSYLAKEIHDVRDLPAPNGSTNLARALQAAAEFHPRKTIIISDGLPDSTTLATEAAEQLTGAIDTIYCGPEQHPGAEFLHSLSRLSGGRGVVWEGREVLAPVLRQLLLAAPSI